MISRKSRFDGPGKRLHESMGALHMHTLYSDGTGTTPEIAGCAARHKLKWIIITDHEHLKAKDNGEEGRYGSVWVLVGSELGDENKPNHYLTFGIDKVPESTDPVKYVEEIREMGGFGAIAHPHEKRDIFEEFPPCPWTAWDANFDGIEIWNQLSQWVEGLTHSNKVMRFLHPLKSLTRPDPETLHIWDRLNLKRKVIGYVGVDAHAMKYSLFGGLIQLKVFHYKVQLRSLRTHLLLEEPLETKDFFKAESQILNALRNGRHFGANHRVGRANGFRFYAERNGHRILPADYVTPGNEIEFVAHTPLEADIRLMHNGHEKISVRGRTLRFKTNEAGVWRIEALRKGRGWIYSNPIRVIADN